MVLLILVVLIRLSSYSMIRLTLPKVLLIAFLALVKLLLLINLLLLVNLMGQSLVLRSNLRRGSGTEQKKMAVPVKFHGVPVKLPPN